MVPKTLQSNTPHGCRRRRRSTTTNLMVSNEINDSFISVGYAYFNLSSSTHRIWQSLGFKLTESKASVEKEEEQEKKKNT